MLSMEKLELPAHKACPHCGHEDITCPECYREYEFCPDCGEEILWPETFLVFTEDKYRGVEENSQDTVNLMVDGIQFATAHIAIDESDKGGDIVYLWLNHSAKWCCEKDKSETIAFIIRKFAEWLRFNWRSFDKQSELPPMVRLSGIKVHKDRPIEHLNRFENFVALRDATKIDVKHLAHDFTRIELGN